MQCRKGKNKTQGHLKNPIHFFGMPFALVALKEVSFFNFETANSP